MKRGKRDKGRLLSPQKVIRMKWSSVCMVFGGRSCGSIPNWAFQAPDHAAQHRHSERMGPSRAAVFKPTENARRILTRRGRQRSLPIRAYRTNRQSGVARLSRFRRAWSGPARSE